MLWLDLQAGVVDLLPFLFVGKLLQSTWQLVRTLRARTPEMLNALPLESISPIVQPAFMSIDHQDVLHSSCELASFWPGASMSRLALDTALLTQCWIDNCPCYKRQEFENFCSSRHFLVTCWRSHGSLEARCTAGMPAPKMTQNASRSTCIACARP